MSGLDSFYLLNGPCYDVILKTRAKCSTGTWRLLFGKCDINNSLSRHISSWNYNIKIYFNPENYKGQIMLVTYGKEQYVQRICWENMKEGDRLEDTTVDGRTILKCIVKKQDIRAWVVLI